MASPNLSALAIQLPLFPFSPSAPKAQVPIFRKDTFLLYQSRSTSSAAPYAEAPQLILSQVPIVSRKRRGMRSLAAAYHFLETQHERVHGRTGATGDVEKSQIELGTCREIRLGAHEIEYASAEGGTPAPIKCDAHDIVGISFPSARQVFSGIQDERSLCAMKLPATISAMPGAFIARIGWMKIPGDRIVEQGNPDCACSARSAPLRSREGP